MNKISSDILIKIIFFLEAIDIVNLQLVNKYYYNKECFNNNYIWKNHLNLTDNYNFSKIIRNIYYSKKYNLCGVCFKILDKNKIMLLCSNCKIKVNDKINLFHPKCFSTIIKISKFTKVFSSKCPYCKESVMGYIS